MRSTGAPALRCGDAACLPHLLPLFRAYQAHYRALTSAGEEQTRAFLARLLAEREGGFVVVAESGGQLVGFATGYLTVAGVLAERLVHLGDLYVTPEHRRQGIATALVHEVARQAASRGIRLVRWLSLAANTELNAWYASLGATSGDFRLFLLPAEKWASAGARPPGAPEARAQDGAGGGAGV